MVRTGIDNINRFWPKALKRARIGLLAHSASVSSNLKYSWDVLRDENLAELVAIFGPQHGLFGETQANMVEWEGYKDPVTGLYIYSLYGKNRKPTKEMLEGIDGIVIDLQDVGSRYYTYIWTMYLVMEACLENKKFVVVLDRPNPISGISVEGPVLKEEYSSFVGLKPLPIRHGMTIGEIALYFKETFLKDLELHVIRMTGWKRGFFWSDTGLEWVNPSPNMPSEKTALLYPGMCLLEGTNLSEGRGTTRPFEIFGAPFIDPFKLSEKLNSLKLDGVFFRPLYFIPSFDKFKGERCGGIQIHILDKRKIKPFKVGVAVLMTVMSMYPEGFSWSSGPYEYEFEKKPIDILAGTSRLREALERGEPLKKLEEWWNQESKEFDERVRKKYLLYE
ncbi:MAG: exo-beta-N-acetylmuramidase NamZ family protein [Candidatus Hydrothermia bacterium]